MAKKVMSWADLSSTQRTGIVVMGLVDAGLRAWALADLAGRPAASVRGPKQTWAVALGLVSSAGVLPTAYLTWGRTAA